MPTHDSRQPASELINPHLNASAAGRRHQRLARLHAQRPIQHKPQHLQAAQRHGGGGHRRLRRLQDHLQRPGGRLVQRRAQRLGRCGRALQRAEGALCRGRPHWLSQYRWRRLPLQRLQSSVVQLQPGLPPATLAAAPASQPASEVGNMHALWHPAASQVILLVARAAAMAAALPPVHMHAESDDASHMTRLRSKAVCVLVDQP
jgi:hypothetical protein